MLKHIQSNSLKSTECILIVTQWGHPSDSFVCGRYTLNIHCIIAVLWYHLDNSKKHIPTLTPSWVHGIIYLHWVKHGHIQRGNLGKISILGASAHTYSIVKDSRLFHSVSRNCVEDHFYNTGCVSSVCVLEVFVWGSWNSGASIWKFMEISYKHPFTHGEQFLIWPNSQDRVQGVILAGNIGNPEANKRTSWFQTQFFPESSHPILKASSPIASIMYGILTSSYLHLASCMANFHGKRLISKCYDG